MVTNSQKGVKSVEMQMNEKGKKMDIKQNKKGNIK